MKKTFVLAAAMTVSLGADAAYRNNDGVAWPTLFGAQKTECTHRKEAAPVAHKPAKVATFESVTFAYNSTAVNGSAEDLNNAKTAIQLEPKAKFVVVGYTDSVGSDAYNQKLSEQRADAVRAWLVDNGVNGDRVTSAGKGESNPIADNATAEGRAKNRRVELHRAQ